MQPRSLEQRLRAQELNLGTSILVLWTLGKFLYHFPHLKKGDNNSLCETAVHLTHCKHPLTRIIANT